MNDPPKVQLTIFQVHLQHGTQLLVSSQHGAQPVGTNPVNKNPWFFFSLNFNLNFHCKHFDFFSPELFFHFSEHPKFYTYIFFLSTLWKFFLGHLDFFFLTKHLDFFTSLHRYLTFSLTSKKLSECSSANNRQVPVKYWM